MCGVGNPHRGIGHHVGILGVARGSVYLPWIRSSGGMGSGLPHHGPCRLPAPGAGCAQAAAAISVPLTHTRCTELAVHSGHTRAQTLPPRQLLLGPPASSALAVLAAGRCPWLPVPMQGPLVRSG